MPDYIYYRLKINDEILISNTHLEGSFVRSTSYVIYDSILLNIDTLFNTDSEYFIHEQDILQQRINCSIGTLILIFLILIAIISFYINKFYSIINHTRIIYDNLEVEISKKQKIINFIKLDREYIFSCYNYIKSTAEEKFQEHHIQLFPLPIIPLDSTNIKKQESTINIANIFSDLAIKIASYNELNSNNVNLEVEYENPILNILFEAIIFRQVIYSLFWNAIYLMPSSGVRA